MAALRAQQAGLTSQIAASNRAEPLGRRHITSLMKFGNQLQWTGRMLQYNFTLPIAAAGVAATYFAMEQDKAFTHVAKVYGDTEAAARQFRREMGLGRREAMKLAEAYKTDELEALNEAFTAISEHYGVQKKEVLEVAGAWAAAGASGRDLADSVNQTMKAIIIGDMDAMTATKALISIQAQYNLSTQELQATLANLNSVENQTGASMADLITGFEKAAGVARSAGVETEQLAAYMAALVPATGSASTAGNALKTIISRLMAPTRESAQVMEAMGLNIKSLEWQSATVTERLALMAEKFNGLGKAAKNSASSVIASRWQINRFEVLMRELVSTTGYYQKALDSAEDQGASFRRMQEELNTVLESDPRRLQRMFVMLQNASVEIIQPLIPHIIYLADQLAKLAQGFASLDPEMQKFVLLGLLALAAVGPIVRYMGALTTLVGTLGHGFVILAHGIGKVAGVLAWMLTPFKMLGTVAMGTLGLISSAVATMLGWFAAVMSGMFARIAGIAIRGWAIQVGIWRAGMALQLLNVKLFYLAFIRFWAAITLVSTTRWAAMWVVIKTITVAAMGVHMGLFKAFYGFIARIWALTLIVTTNMWGRIAVAMVLFAKRGVMGVAAVFRGIIPFLIKWGKWLVSPWSIAVLAIMGIIYTFREQIVQVWENIVQYLSNETNGIGQIFASMRDYILDAFNALPGGVQRALVAVVTVIRDAALAVYDWFSYINPFAQHSPSLVQNVTRGMDAIDNQFSRLSNIKNYVSAAYAEIKKFGQLTAGLGLGADALEQKQNRKTLKKAGASSAAIASYDRLVKLSSALSAELKRLEARINTQERVVDNWQDKLDQANARLEKQQRILDRLQGKLDKYQEKLSDAQADLDYFANAPLKGMQAMEDQIFANTMAQTRLRLEMMNMEDVVGTFDDLQEKMEAVNGLQEILRGTQSDLRAAGAGSEILNQYDSEIQKLEDQKTAYTNTANTLNQMQVELEKLQREAERLDLVKAMKFDALQYEIEKAANNMEELSFNEIMAGIAGANKEIEKYTPLVEKANDAVEKQQGIIDKLTIARDKVQQRLDKEEETLSRIRDRYNEVNDALQEVNSTINDVVSAAEKMNDALDKKKKKKGAGSEYISPGLQNFLDAGKATFEDPGGKGIPPRKDWSNQADKIREFTEQLGADTADMFANLNPFAPLKEKAKAVWNWVRDKALAIAGKVKEFFIAAFDGVSVDTSSFDKVKETFENILEFLTGVAKDIAKVFQWAWELLWPEIKKIGTGAWDGLKKLWEEVAPKLEEFKELWGPIGESIENLWKVAKPILAVLVGFVLVTLKGLLSAIGEAIGPAIESIGKILGGLIDIVKGIVKIIAGVFTADLGMLFDGLGDLFGGLWSVIWNTVWGGVKLVWNLIKGFVEGVWGFFVWLYDILVGHSVVPDLIDAIVDTFKLLKTLAQWVWNKVLKPIYDFFVDLWDDVTDELTKWRNRVEKAWDLLTKLGTWFWNSVLKPVWNWITDLWDTKVKGELEKWRNRIETAWSLLTALGAWFWNNVLKPIWDNIKELWNEKVKPEFTEWRNRIESAWDKLKGLGGWITKHVMDPVKSAFTSGWNAIKQWFIDNADILSKPVSSVVNTVLRAVNAMIRGLNKVADVLPGVDWNIDTIDLLARGGIPRRKANRGFMTNGARAIVGEGKANHPEFVIPTDPTYRNRARALLTMAASKIGMGSGVNSRGAAGDTPSDIAAVLRNHGSVSSDGVPQYAIGGWLSDKWGDLKGIAKQVAKLPKNAVGQIMDPLLAAGRAAAYSTNYPPVASPALYSINELEAWVKGANAQANQGQKKADDITTGGPKVRAALAWAKTQAGKPYVWGGVGPDGYDCSGFMSAITNHLLGRSLHSRVGTTATFPWSGFQFGTVSKGFTIGSARNYGSTGIGHMAGTLGGVNVESRGGQGVVIGSSARGALDTGFNTRYHLAMKQGGIALARRGQPTPIVAGDGRYDEAIVPLPHGWQNLRNNGSGETHIHINGDLSFPNIKNGDDAELFISNLENIARD
ncbi:MAG: tape measure protein [Phage AS32]|nr:MAG: tape measure protein [Phage AS32]